ncbi:protein FAM200A-like [Prorops nasuta]|uniref:protein FAM200A-like n=1 Tax=Prorops nasuta TaxID=863751 RepID=UPI0034CEB0E3
MDSNDNPKKTKAMFRNDWLDYDPSWKVWLQKAQNDDSKFYCLACDKEYVGGLSQVKRHASRQIHSNNVKRLEKPEDFDAESPTCSTDEQFNFNDRVKAAEIKVAAFFAEHNLSFLYSAELLKLFQDIGKEPNVLQSMSLGRTKATKIVNNVLCTYETKRIADNLKTNKFSVFVDETTDITNEKKMTLLTRYVDRKSICVQIDLLQLINLDASDCSADKLFTAFSNELIRHEIPFSQITGLTCDNASVMIGKHESFQTKLLQKCPQLITMPCICHSSALAASHACKTIPLPLDNFIKKLVSFINLSSKRTAIFDDLQIALENDSKKLLKYAETRCLSRHNCIKRILELWSTLHQFLLEQMAEKVNQAEELLVIMQNSETKAYLLFLEPVLERFNSFNASFQAKETKIQLLHEASINFLMFFANKFLKPAILQKEIFLPNLHNIDFSKKSNQLDLTEIDVGSECAHFLEDEIMDSKLTVEHAEVIRPNCLCFLIKASEEIRKRFPLCNKFLENLNILKANIALFHDDREKSGVTLLHICRQLGTFDERSIAKEWIYLYRKESPEVRSYWSKLPFDEMWIAICSEKDNNDELKYPQLRSLLCLVRSLPHSNAEAERCFSIIPDCKTSKRNKIGADTLNAICVLKYALRCRNETSLSMNITKGHIDLMKSNNLYSSTPEKKKKKIHLQAASDVHNEEVDEDEENI